jgi:hypothetical protein
MISSWAAGVECVKEFNGKLYYDDRLFLVHLCLGTVDTDGDLVTTTIYHENAPPDAKWCLVAYRNYETFPAFSVLHFRTKDDAMAYRLLFEPSTPLISRGGKPAEIPYDEYVNWKTDQNLQEYDYRKCYQPGGANPKEIIMQTREQFSASENLITERLDDALLGPAAQHFVGSGAREERQG